MELPKILVADDEENIHYSLRRLLADEYAIVSARSGEQVLPLVEAERPLLVLLDIRMPNLDGLEVLAGLKARHPRLPVIVMTAHGTPEAAITATRLEAYDYVLKPVDVPKLRLLIKEALEAQRVASRMSARAPGENQAALVGQSAAMQEVYKFIGKAARRDVTVLITGESGTGKEMVARAIHSHSPRATGPFVAVNCAAIPENLLESELFGYEKGAFSGADETRPGLLEQAQGGTLLLDEVAELPTTLQAKLLRVLQERQIHRLGGRTPIPIDARVIAATNRDIEEAVAQGRFRQDLYYRLNVLRLHMPPLRERAEDILALAEHFLAQRETTGGTHAVISSSGKARLLGYPWPGNVRELQNAIDRALAKARGPLLSEEHFDLAAGFSPAAASYPDKSDLLGRGLESLLVENPGFGYERVEAAMIEKALEICTRNQVRAAKLLGISRNMLRNRIKKYRLS